MDWTGIISTVKDWIVAHPYQTAFQLVWGTVIAVPSLLSMPLLFLFGWTAQGVRAGEFDPDLAIDTQKMS